MFTLYEGGCIMTFKEKRDEKGKLKGWKATVCVGRDTNNKQKWKTLFIRVDDPRIEDLTPKKKEAEAQRIAEEFEREQKSNFDAESHSIDKYKITIPQYINLIWWENIKAEKHRPGTESFYKYMSEDISAYFSALPPTRQKLCKIDALTVKQYINYLNTKAVTKDGQPYSNTTIIRHYQTLRNIINSAIRFGYLKEDPCRTLALKDKPRKEQHKGGFLDEDDAAKFVELLNNAPLFWRCFMNVLINQGLRRGEAVGLQWGDIDGQNLTMRVCRSVTPDKAAASKLHIDTTKTGEERTIALDEDVYRMLMQLKADREEKLHCTLLPTSFVFCKPNDAYMPIYPTAPTRWLSLFIKKHNLPDVSPHDLRRTWASLADSTGASMKQIQDTLGHKKPTTTQDFYIRTTPDGQRKALKGVSNALRPQKHSEKVDEKAQ